MNSFLSRRVLTSVISTIRTGSPGFDSLDVLLVLLAVQLHEEHEDHADAHEQRGDGREDDAYRPDRGSGLGGVYGQVLQLDVARPAERHASQACEPRRRRLLHEGLEAVVQPLGVVAGLQAGDVDRVRYDGHGHHVRGRNTEAHQEHEDVYERQLPGLYQHYEQGAQRQRAHAYVVRRLLPDLPHKVQPHRQVSGSGHEQQYHDGKHDPHVRDLHVGLQVEHEEGLHHHEAAPSEHVGERGVAERRVFPHFPVGRDHRLHAAGDGFVRASLLAPEIRDERHRAYDDGYDEAGLQKSAVNSLEIAPVAGHVRHDDVRQSDGDQPAYDRYEHAVGREPGALVVVVRHLHRQRGIGDRDEREEREVDDGGGDGCNEPQVQAPAQRNGPEEVVCDARRYREEQDVEPPPPPPRVRGVGKLADERVADGCIQLRQEHDNAGQRRAQAEDVSKVFQIEKADDRGAERAYRVADAKGELLPEAEPASTALSNGRLACILLHSVPSICGFRYT